MLDKGASFRTCLSESVVITMSLVSGLTEGIRPAMQAPSISDTTISVITMSGGHVFMRSRPALQLEAEYTMAWGNLFGMMVARISRDKSSSSTTSIEIGGASFWVISIADISGRTVWAIKKNRY